MMSSEVNGGGIVKKLLFPRYADSGRNDTYLPTSSSTSANSGTSTGSIPGVHHQQPQHQPQHHQPQKANSVVSSEASTVIRDNRSGGGGGGSSIPTTTMATTIASPPKVQPGSRFARSISTTAVVSDFPFDDEAAARNPADEQDNDNDTTSTTSDSITPHRRREHFPSDQHHQDDDHDDAAAANMTKTHSSPSFEEEATPAQTAFGKQLLFQRTIVDRRIIQDEDALSTASESGTIVDLAKRLNDIDEMIQNDDDNGEQGLPRSTVANTTCAATKLSPRYENDPKRVLAMPTLDVEQEQPVHRPLNLHQLLRSPKRNTVTTTGPPQPSASTILSTAMRRFTASPQSHVSSNATPTSFLLRSPGSSVYEGAATERRIPQRPGRRINTKVLPLRSCFSFDVVANETTVPYRRTTPEEEQTKIASTDRSASWDVGGRSAAVTPLHRLAFTTPTRPIQRIEMEREDAIDILSCLVERGISWKPLCINPDAEEKEDSVVELVQNLDVPDDRKACLNELVKSHEYALEMKRASKSASVWLQSIGRPSPSRTTNRKLVDDATTSSSSCTSNKDNAFVIHRTIAPMTTDGKEEETTTTATTTPMDLVTAKALLRRAQQEIKDRNDQYDRLNDELAQCRAEIGRLNTLNSQFRSNVNRSILDENDDDTHEDDEEEESIKHQVVVLEDEDRLVIGLDQSFARQHSFDPTTLAPNHIMIANFCAALEQANAIITQLHDEKGTDEPAPIVQIPTIVVPMETSPTVVQNNSPGNAEERTINVRMLDAENFETDWDDLVPPMPTAPPEHDLRSPIVSAVLQSWTTDRGLHESLLQWIEQILDTDNNDDDVPPLTLSGLDHQVRDGFCLHILPLLLRKPDIHVNVQTRLQRRTTYDLAVTVEPTGPSTVLDTSEATTAVISNREPSARLSYDEFAEPNIKSPDDDDDDEVPTGAWTSISGALWGSLTTSTRRKPSSADVEEPYHRVVSAPAGRIGVTFVEYRGHCMVSDVAVDSPLLNWIYPSDVLIAIDELPVSGMRVRDIIKVLKDRSERQRALRVVSSHSMSNLTASH